MVMIDEFTDTAVMVEAAISGLVLPTNAVPPGAPAATAHLDMMATSAQRALVFEALMRLLWALGETGEKPTIASFVRFRLLSFDDLLSTQRDYMRRLGFSYQEGNFTRHIRVLNADVHVGFALLESEEGSLYKKIKASVTFTSSELRQALLNVVAILAAEAILSSPPVSGAETLIFNPGGAKYVCTIDSFITDDYAGALEDAVRTLSTTEFASEQHEREVWMARQMCLAAAGHPPGRIDGIRGENTRLAEEAYSREHDDIRIMWSSPVFARHVLQHAFKSPDYARQME